MTEASLGKWGAITIRFTDGKTRKFRLAPSVNAIESAGKLAVHYRTEEIYYSQWGRLLIEAEIGIKGVRKLGKIMNEQWVATNNALISKQKQSDKI